MAKNGMWSFVFPADRAKLKKYFKREINSAVYIRIYEIQNIINFKQYLQLSGNDEGFNSIPIYSDSLESDIKRDFPYIKTLLKTEPYELHGNGRDQFETCKSITGFDTLNIQACIHNVIACIA